MNRILFIVEGEITEPLIIAKLQEQFFSSDRYPECAIEYLILPACTNIYTIWKKMEADEWETEIVEVIKELCKNVSSIDAELSSLSSYDYSEIYLFFDYDGHADDIPEGQRDRIILSMLQSFCNESENGKLYLSFPMAEAIKDFKEFGRCQNSECFADISLGKKYKKIVNERALLKELKKIDKGFWLNAIRLFLQKTSCLYDLHSIDFKEYRRHVTPEDIFSIQLTKCIKPFNKVMILSGFPEFLLDYFGEDFWKDHVTKKILNNAGCKQR